MPGVTDSGDVHRVVTVGAVRAAYGGCAVAAVLFGAGPSQFHLSAWGVAVEVLAVVVVLVTVVLIVPAVHLLLCAVILVEQRRLGRPTPMLDSSPTRMTRITRLRRGWIGRIRGGVVERWSTARAGPGSEADA